MRGKSSLSTTATGGASGGDNVDVCVKLPDNSIKSYNMQPWDTICMLCENLAVHLQVHAHTIRISYTGKTLNKSHSFGYLGVRPETVLRVEIIKPETCTLKVCGPEETFTVKASNLWSIETLKSEIETVASILPNQQTLQVKSQILKDNQMTLIDAGLKDGAEITLTHQPKAASNAENDSQPKDELDDDEKKNVMGTFDASGRRVEVVFSFDTTGSMYPCLQQVRTNLRSTVTQLIENIEGIRIGIMAHGDYCDFHNYVTSHVDLTSDVNSLVSFVDSVGSTGGGDCPECYEWVLRKAQSFDWSESSAKAVVIIGDDVPHPPSMTDQNIYWMDEVDMLANCGIKVYGIQALNKTSSSPFYREMALRTGGAYVTFNNFAVITEMFLAVCYHEASEDLYDEFVEACVEEGNENSDDIKEVLQQIKVKADDVPQENHIVEAPWWKEKQPVRSEPLYEYSSETDSWKPFISDRASRFSSIANGKSKSSFKRRFSFRHKKRQCNVM